MLRFYIPNMTCGGCAKSVTKALLSVDLRPQSGDMGKRHRLDVGALAVIRLA